jgi:hypothetical protein
MVASTRSAPTRLPAGWCRPRHRPGVGNGDLGSAVGGGDDSDEPPRPARSARRRSSEVPPNIDTIVPPRKDRVVGRRAVPEKIDTSVIRSPVGSSTTGRRDLVRTADTSDASVTPPRPAPALSRVFAICMPLEPYRRNVARLRALADTCKVPIPSSWRFDRPFAAAGGAARSRPVGVTPTSTNWRRSCPPSRPEDPRPFRHPPLGSIRHHVDGTSRSRTRSIATGLWRSGSTCTTPEPLPWPPGPPTPGGSVLRMPGAFSAPFVTVAGERLSLDAIEHAKIRRFADPRIHAALVCGSVSCPTLRPPPTREPSST